MHAGLCMQHALCLDPVRLQLTPCLHSSSTPTPPALDPGCLLGHTEPWLAKRRRGGAHPPSAAPRGLHSALRATSREFSVDSSARQKNSPCFHINFGLASFPAALAAPPSPAPKSSTCAALLAERFQSCRRRCIRALHSLYYLNQQPHQQCLHAGAKQQALHGCHNRGPAAVHRCHHRGGQQAGDLDGGHANLAGNVPAGLCTSTEGLDKRWHVMQMAQQHDRHDMAKAGRRC